MKIGIVSAIDPAKCAARVQFPDNDDVVSYWLPVVQPKTLKDRFYYMPDVGEQVVCLLDENGEQGVILGAIYSDADPPPVTSPDKWHVAFEDGTTIEYSRATHTLALNIKGDVTIATDGNTSVTTTGSTNITTTGKTIVKSDGTIELDGGSGSVKGLVQEDCLCALTKAPHIMTSKTVKASK